MAQIIQIHPQNPQARLLSQVVDVLLKGGIIVYPTDSSYALGCALGNREAKARIQSIRDLDLQHNFTLVCRDLSEIAAYARIDNPTFRLLKANTPGPYTFILNASKQVPKRLLESKRKTIGLRVPDNMITKMLLQQLEAPLLSVSFIVPEHEQPITSVYDIEGMLQSKVDLIVDGGVCGHGETTIVDLTGSYPEVIREGKGAIEPFV